ncbi:MAG: APC family permease [Sulfolobaceae archaeon]|nr:APC family permease [Sulfolobaceae archaeon]
MSSLKRGVLYIKENYAQAMAVTAPLGSVVSTTTAAVMFAGYGVVFTTLLSLIASALWIYALTIYQKRIASAGGFYTFSYSAWRSKKVAFGEAIIEFTAYSLLNAVNIIAIYQILLVSSQLLDIRLPGYVIWLAVALSLVYQTLISLLEVKKLLGYIVTISASTEAALLIGLFIFAILSGHYRPDILLSPSHVSLGELATAFVLTTTSISGAGAATYLGEETKNPRQNVTKGMWLALGIGGLSMYLGTYALVSLWSGSLNSLASATQPLFIEAYSISSILLLFTIMLSINSLLSSNIGTTLASARILFNLARENSAPAIFKKMTREGQPLVGTLVVGAITIIVAVLGLLYLGYANALGEIGAITSVLWLLGRAVDGTGAVVLTYRLSELTLKTFWKYGIIPLAADAVNSWGVITSILSADLLQIISYVAIFSIAIIWYFLKARKGRPGSLVVDEYNNVVSLEEYLAKAKR